MVINYGACQLNYGADDGISSFYMRLLNKESQVIAMPATFLNDLFASYSGTPELLTATYDDGTVYDVKGSGNSVIDFYVPVNKEGIFKITWKDGIFVLGGNASTTAYTYRLLVRSQGCKLCGDYNVPDNFMNGLFYGHKNFNFQQGDVFDFSKWNPSSNNVVNYFMSSTFNGCSSLTNFIFPDISHWPTINISYSFFSNTFYGCSEMESFNFMSSNTVFQPDYSTRNLFDRTFYGCSKMNYCALPRLGYNGSSQNNQFRETFTGAFPDNYSTSVCLPGYYTGSVRGPYTNSMGIDNNKVYRLFVDNALLSNYKSDSTWSNIDDSKFVGQY